MGGRGVDQLWTTQVSMPQQRPVRVAMWNPANEDWAGATSSGSCSVVLFDLTRCEVTC
jgi:hypothetical protein